MKVRNAVLLAGGTGSRIQPLTSLFQKHLIPIHNKFLIDYPLTTLQNLEIENTTIVMGGDHFDQIVAHVKDGSKYNMSVNYVYQEKAIGIAQGINLCKNFIKDDFVVILGDNIFDEPVRFKDSDKAQILLYKHKELQRFGVASIKNDKIVKIEEKPKTLSKKFENYAISGCYKFDQQYFEYFKDLKPSARNEYEITDIIQRYNENNNLDYWIYMDQWLDCGTFNSINFANNYFYERDK